MLSVLLYSILSVQIVYSLQLNSTDINYRERQSDSYVECANVQHIELQIVYNVQLNCTDSNYTEAAATCSAT